MSHKNKLGLRVLQHFLPGADRWHLCSKNCICCKARSGVAFPTVQELYWPGSFSITSDITVTAVHRRSHRIIAAPGDVTHVWPHMTCERIAWKKRSKRKGLHYALCLVMGALCHLTRQSNGLERIWSQREVADISLSIKMKQENCLNKTLVKICDSTQIYSLWLCMSLAMMFIYGKYTISVTKIITPKNPFLYFVN